MAGHGIELAQRPAVLAEGAHREHGDHTVRLRHLDPDRSSSLDDALRHLRRAHHRQERPVRADAAQWRLNAKRDSAGRLLRAMHPRVEGAATSVAERRVEEPAQPGDVLRVNLGDTPHLLLPGLELHLGEPAAHGLPGER